MIKIGNFSKYTRISVRMLRHYNEIGLLIPTDIDKQSAYRYYSESQLDKANKITALKEMGFSLNTIKMLLENEDSKFIKDELLEKKKSLIEEGLLIKERLKMLENTIYKFEEENYLMKYTVNIKELPKRNVASLRKVIGNYQMEGILWGELMGSGADIRVSYPCYSTAIFHDGEYKESEVDVEIQIAVKKLASDIGNIKFKEVQSQNIVSCVFTGSYSQIPDVSEAIINFITEKNLTSTGPMFNIYLVSPNEDENPDNWVTEVCFPIN